MNEIRFSEFRDNYCKHQNAFLVFNENEEAVNACSYKDGKIAQSWSDWQPCTAQNCPALRKAEKNE